MRRNRSRIYRSVLVLEGTHGHFFCNFAVIMLQFPHLCYDMVHMKEVAEQCGFCDILFFTKRL